MAVPFKVFAFPWCFLCCALLNLVCSFNLEPRIPIVKLGSPKSHFGYSVAQHKSILEKISGGTYEKSWILVGAPKDQNLQPGTNRTGALWKCPLTTNTTDCVQVKTDGFKTVNEGLAEPAEDEIKEDQWLGVTLKSQGPGGKVLVCAHRYMYKGAGYQLGFGLCYILTQQLKVSANLEPCKGKPTNQGHQQYGFCQAGTSGLLTEDEAVLGVPGPYTWRGTVHTINISDSFLAKDKTKYFGPVTKHNSPVDKYSYLGYSVTAGRFFGNYMSYVGGAPRANGTGQVVFFSRKMIGVKTLRVDLILQGEENFAFSSFGFEVLAVDIDNDGMDDLIVGAPFYYTAENSGAVYVYMNNFGGFKRNHPYTKIEGVKGESRFGFSMTSLGDLNRDGYNDVAIGAPYEGQGAIYIYLGTANGLDTKEPSQVIYAEDIPGIPADAFGYSLSGGIDMDNNGYPDLLTSSFCSDRVVLLRARPIIDIQTEVKGEALKDIDPTKRICREDIKSEVPCVSFEACFKMDNEAGTRTGLMLKYSIEEISDRPHVRVHFDTSNKFRSGRTSLTSEDQHNRSPSIVQKNISLLPEDMGHSVCETEIVYLLDAPRDVLQPLKFKLSYEIIQREPQPVREGDPMPDINDYPILNQQEAVRYFEGTFAKDCGDDNKCISDLHVYSELFLERHETQPRYILRLGEQDTVSLMVNITNTGEPAYQSSLIVDHHPALRFDHKASRTEPYQCSPASAKQPSTQIICSVGNPLRRFAGPLILSFKESGYAFDSRFIHFSVEANTTSTEATPQQPLRFEVQVIKKAEISITGSVDPEQAFYGGEVVGESAIKTLEQIGMEITHKYVIDNRGPWKVNDLQVAVLWPYQVKNNKEQGKWLLYMTDIPTVDGNGECEIDPNLVNELFLSENPFPGGLPDVEGEQETRPGGTGSGVKVTKTKTTVTKVSSTTIKKKETKSSSKKNISVSTERTSHGYSSGSYGSSSGYDETQGFYDNDEDGGSGFGHETHRQHGRTQTRVARRVYTSGHESKYPEQDLGVNTLDKDSKDGDVVSHHEESHSSTRTSPDGSTTISKHHHESKKVTVSGGPIEEIPGGRWSGSGGYQRGYNEAGTRHGHQSGYGHTQGFGEAEGSGSFGVDRGYEGGVRRVQTINRQETIRRTHTGGDSSFRVHSGQRFEGDLSSQGTVVKTEGSSGRVYTGSGDAYIGEQEIRGRTSGSEIGHETNIHAGGDRVRIHAGSQSGGVGTYGGYNRSEQEWRTSSSGSGAGTTRTHSGSNINYNYDKTNENLGTSGQNWRHEQNQNWRVQAGNQRTGSESNFNNQDRGYGSDGSQTYSYGHDESYNYRGNSGSNYDPNQSGGNVNYDPNQSGGNVNYDPNQSGGNVNYDPNQSGGNVNYDVNQSGYERSGGNVRTNSGQGNRQRFDWNDRSQNQGTVGGQYGREFSGSGGSHQDGNYRHTQVYESSRTSSNTKNINSGGNFGGSGSQNTRWGSTGGNSNLRTTTFELNSGGAGHSQGAGWNTHSSQGGRDHSFTQSDGYADFGLNEFNNNAPNENGTYRRVEIDPETGATIVYTKKVYSSNWHEDKPYNEQHQSISHSGHQRNRRELRRVKREKEVIIKPQAIKDDKTGKTMQVVDLRCDGDNPTAKCFRLICNIRNLDANQAASIRIKSRLWNSTLVEDYPRVSYVSIKSRGELLLPQDIKNDQDQSDDISSAETLAYPDLLDQLPPEEVPLWVILVSVFAGLLVLIIIVLVLWKLGFFERKRPDPTLSGNLDKDANGY